MKRPSGLPVNNSAAALAETLTFEGRRSRDDSPHGRLDVFGKTIKVGVP